MNILQFFKYFDIGGFLFTSNLYTDYLCASIRASLVNLVHYLMILYFGTARWKKFKCNSTIFED